MPEPLILLPCAKSKRKVASPAGEMYTGTYHKLARSIALLVTKPEYVLILSAKYGFLRMTDVIEPYEIKMGTKKSIPIWMLREQLKSLQEIRGLLSLGDDSKENAQSLSLRGSRRVVSFLTGPYRKVADPLFIKVNLKVEHLAVGAKALGPYLRWLKDMLAGMQKSASPITLLKPFTQ